MVPAQRAAVPVDWAGAAGRAVATAATAGGAASAAAASDSALAAVRRGVETAAGRRAEEWEGGEVKREVVRLLRST